MKQGLPTRKTAAFPDACLHNCRARQAEIVSTYQKAAGAVTFSEPINPIRVGKAEGAPAGWPRLLAKNGGHRARQLHPIGTTEIEPDSPTIRCVAGPVAGIHAPG